jgi:hypothetical protein
MHWVEKSFAELSATELYRVLQLRQRVFVIEQACIYLDVDGLDPQAYHLWTERDGEIVAYLRVLPAAVAFWTGSRTHARRLDAHLAAVWSRFDPHRRTSAPGEILRLARICARFCRLHG